MLEAPSPLVPYVASTSLCVILSWPIMTLSIGANSSPRNVPVQTVSAELHEVGALLRRVGLETVLPRAGRVEIERKSWAGGQENVTEVDLRSSEQILSVLRRQYPASGSEEDLLPYEVRRAAEGFWIIDPIDGTDEFIGGHPGFALQGVFVRRAADGRYEPNAAVLFLPQQDKLWLVDQEGRIAALQGSVTVELPDRPAGEELRCYVRSLDFDTPETAAKIAQYDRIARRLGRPLEIVRSGGAGAGLGLLLEQKVDLVMFTGPLLKEWDVGPYLPFLSACGGFVCSAQNEALGPFNSLDGVLRGSMVASRSLRRDEVMAALSA